MSVVESLKSEGAAGSSLEGEQATSAGGEESSPTVRLMLRDGRADHLKW